MIHIPGKGNYIVFIFIYNYAAAYAAVAAGSIIRLAMRFMIQNVLI
jgi:hypothetical protein